MQTKLGCMLHLGELGHKLLPPRGTITNESALHLPAQARVVRSKRPAHFVRLLDVAALFRDQDVARKQMGGEHAETAVHRRRHICRAVRMAERVAQRGFVALTLVGLPGGHTMPRTPS